MSTQLDWVGSPAARPPFKDIRNQRETVAQEKARLCLELGTLVKTIPPSIASGGSVDQVRKWMATREAAMRVCANKRASVEGLQYAIRCMKGACK